VGIQTPITVSEPKGFHLPLIFRNVWQSLVILYLPIFFVISFLSYQIYLQILESNYQPYFEAQQNRLDNAMNTFSRELGHIQQLIRLLRYNQQFEQSLPFGRPPDFSSIGKVFTDFSNVSSYISQVRWLDKHGMEKVRVNINGDDIIVVEQKQLQDKSKRDYFQAGMKLRGDEVFISAINPNIENGKVIMPLEKTIRAVIHTAPEDGLQDGVLIINFLLNDMLESLNQGQGNKLRIIDNQGYWIMHPNASLDFRSYTDYLVRTNTLLQPDVIRTIIKQQPLHNFIKDNRLISYSVIDIGDNTAESRHRLFFIDSSEPDLLNVVEKKVALIVFSPTISILLIVLFLIWRFLYDGRKQYDLFKELAIEKEALSLSNQQLKIAYEQQQQMQDSMVELRKLSSMGMMVAGLAHELNTPLGGASLTLSSLDSSRRQLALAVTEGLRKSDLQDYLTQTADTIELAQKNLRRASDLVTSFKRLAVDRHTDEATEFDLMLVIKDVTTTSLPRLKGLDIRVDISGPEKLAIQSYAGIVSQLFQNLIDNAIAHGFAGSAGGQVQIDVFQETLDHVTVTISDNGNGIEAERLKKIFDPFETNARGEGHTGLGLHLCHQWITQLLQGSISVSSEPGKGTIFILVIPVQLNELG
jgi:signal transduction histidine kinase